MTDHVGGPQTVKNIATDAGISAFFAIGGYLTSDDGPLKDASPGTKRLLNAVFGAPMAGKILLPDLHASWKERNVPDFLMTALSTTIGALGVGMNDREMINSAAMLAALFSMAGHLEDGVIQKNEQGINDLEASVPKQVTRRVASEAGSHSVETVALEHVKEGDHLIVPHGETAPVDGVVKEIKVHGQPHSTGSVSLPRALNGENTLIPVQVGERIPQGAIASEGSHLVMQATANGAESTIMRNVEYLRAAEEAAPAKAVHSIRNGMNYVYIPMMVAACAVQFIASYYQDKKKHKLTNAIDSLKEKIGKQVATVKPDNTAPKDLPPAASSSRSTSLVDGLPVVHETPPALEVAKDDPRRDRTLPEKLEKSTKKTAELAIKMAPCAIAAGMLILPFLKNKLAAHHGVIIREDAAFEKTQNITHVLTDIRGTLTKGMSEFRGLHVWDEAAAAFSKLEGQAEQGLLQLLGKAEAESSHPLAKSIRQAASDRGLDLSLASHESVTVHPGHGVVGKLGSENIVVGSKELLRTQGSHSPSEAMQKAAEAMGDVVYFNHNGKVGVAALEDPLRAGAAEALYELRKKGKKVVLVTGMPESSARAIMAKLETKPLPENPLILRAEQNFIGTAEKKGKDDVVREFLGEKNVLATVGDGENDAPFMSLVKQHGGVSFAIGSTGAGSTKEVASMVIEGIHQLPELMTLSKKVSQALIINVSAAAAWMSFLIGSHIFGLEMKPEKASVAHEAPTFLLTIASLVQSFRLTKGISAKAMSV